MVPEVSFYSLFVLACIAFANVLFTVINSDFLKVSLWMSMCEYESCSFANQVDDPLGFYHVNWCLLFYCRELHVTVASGF